MHDIDGQVLGVTGRSTRNGSSIYDVAFSDGNKYTTFSAELATKAQQLQGQPSTARVEVSQRGKYTNYNIEDIAPQGQLAPLALPPGSPIGAPGGFVAGPAPASPLVSPPLPAAAPIQITPQADPQEREQRIVRQSAYGAAFNFVGRLFEGAGPEAFGEAVALAKALTEQLAAFGLNGVAPQASTPQSVAAEINAEVPGGITVGVVETPPTQGATIPW